MVERADLQLLEGPFKMVLEEDLAKRVDHMLKNIPTNETSSWDVGDGADEKFTTLCKVVSEAKETVFLESMVVNVSETAKRFIVSLTYGDRNYIIESSSSILTITPKKKRYTLSDMMD